MRQSTTLVFAVALLTCQVVVAQEHLPVPAYQPLDAAASNFPLTTLAESQVRALSLTEARRLLSSTEAPAWHVLAAHAPTCTPGADKRKCARQKRECAQVKAFAIKNSVHAVCSALYEQTTILVTTARAPEQQDGRAVEP